MTWAVEEFLQQAITSLNGQGYKIDALLAPRALGQHPGTWRCGVRSSDERMPSSVIIKRAAPDMPWRWNDWACQYLLSDVPGLRGLGPEFFAGDDEIGFYLLEDLGLGSDLGAALLLGDSRADLAASLLACGLAGLHAGSFGREKPFGELRSRLPGALPSRLDEIGRWRTEVRPALNALQAGLADRLAPLMQVLMDEMAEPGEFLVLTHGDWQAQSIWYGNAGPRFLDFRNGAFRHALLDLAAWEARCAPNSAALITLEREYRGELERLGAERGPRYDQALARARAWMALEHLARGDRSPGVRALFERASKEAGMEELEKIQA